MDEKRSYAAPAIVFGLLLLLAVVLPGLYVGSYYSLVERNQWPDAEVQVIYRYGGDAAHVVFTPMHELDRRLRPSYWEPEFLEESWVHQPAVEWDLDAVILKRESAAADLEHWGGGATDIDEPDLPASDGPVDGVPAP